MEIKFEHVSLVIDDVGLINKEKLRDAVRKNYEYNNNGRLPTIIFYPLIYSSAPFLKFFPKKMKKI